MEILNYKCPNCSAGLEFNSKTQKMACEYCGNSYTVEELEELEEPKASKRSSCSNWQQSCVSSSLRPTGSSSIWSRYSNRKRAIMSACCCFG